jgi:hypothetical protein
MSTALPGPNGMTARIGRDGQVSADAAARPAIRTAAARKMRRTGELLRFSKEIQARAMPQLFLF